MARPFSMSRLWHHVSILAEVDGFVIPSPTWLPRFVHVLERERRAGEEESEDEERENEQVRGQNVAATWGTE